MDQSGNAGNTVQDVLVFVYRALMDNGYSAAIQLANYIVDGDPTYITEHGNARTLIGQYDRDEYLEAALKEYLRTEHGQDSEPGNTIGLVRDAYISKKQTADQASNAIVGYLMTGDPTYIISTNSARSRIMQYEREEIIRYLLEEYMKDNYPKKIQ